MKTFLFLLSLVIFVSAAPQNSWKLLKLSEALRDPTIQAMTEFGLKEFMKTAFKDQAIDCEATLMSFVQVIATRVVSNIVIGTTEDGLDIYGEANVVKFNADVVDIYGTPYDVDIVVLHLPDHDTFTFLSYELN